MPLTELVHCWRRNLRPCAPVKPGNTGPNHETGLARPKRIEQWVKFSYLFLGLGILPHSVAIAHRSRNLSYSDLLRKIAGTRSLDKNLPEDQKETATAAKALLTDMKQDSSYDGLSIPSFWLNLAFESWSDPHRQTHSAHWSPATCSKWKD